MTDEECDDVSNIDVPLFGFTRPKPSKIALKRSIHGQVDGIIYAIVASIVGETLRERRQSELRKLSNSIQI